MNINASMSLDAVQERMGTEATRDEAAKMVEFLLVGNYETTEEIPEGDWLELCELAAQAIAQRDRAAALAPGEFL